MVNLAAGSSAGESAPLTFNKKECLESKLVRTSSEKIFCLQESVSLLNQCLGEENQDSIKNFQRTENPWKGHKKTFFLKKKQTLWPLFMDGVRLPQGYCHLEEAVYFLPFKENDERK